MAEVTAEQINECRNLLAIIHRDGGHYVTDHGWMKAVKDAHQIWADLQARITQLEEALGDTNRRFVTSIERHNAQVAALRGKAECADMAFGGQWMDWYEDGEQGCLCIYCGMDGINSEFIIHDEQCPKRLYDTLDTKEPATCTCGHAGEEHGSVNYNEPMPNEYFADCNKCDCAGFEPRHHT